MEKHKEKEFKLKDGSLCTVREARKEDAEKLLKYIKAAFGESDYLLRYPEEATWTIEEEGKILENFRNSKNTIMLIGIINDEVIAAANIGALKFMKNKHRTNIGISIAKEHWRKGLGTILFNEMENFAKNIGSTQMELEFIEGNEKAKKLYEKMGFRIVGEIPNAIILKDGTVLSEFKMVKEI